MVESQSYGDMTYLAKHLPQKENPELLLPGVKSAIVVIKNYKNTTQKHLEGNNKVARYAAGIDYHWVIGDALQLLCDRIQTTFPGVHTFYGVDSRPLPERTLAILAGIGFRGKNSMIIRPKLGSYFFIGVILTTAELPIDSPLLGGCGTCTRCIDACPTAAIGSDGSFNMTACISYKTIEHKTPMTNEEADTADGWVFGCDICQEVCPFNHDKTPLTDWIQFSPDAGVGHSLTPIDGDIVIPKNTPLYRSRKRVRGNIK